VIGSILMGVAGLFLMGYLYVAFLPTIITNTDDLRSVPTVEAGKSCTTTGAGVCTLALDGTTFKFDTEGMTVTETSPGAANRTSSTTVSADRESISIAGLTPATGYIFTVEYQAIDTTLTPGFAPALRITPLLMIVVVVAAIVAAVGFTIFKRRRMA
jgi:subtilase family serine protease